MKKQLFWIMAFIVACLLLGCTDAPAADLRLSDPDLSGTDQIRMQNAHNGLFTVITDPQDIAEITAFLQQFAGSDPESGKGYYEGTYQLQFYRADAEIFSIAFGDSDCFYTGKGADGYPLRYLLPEQTIREKVIPFLSQFDQSGFEWN